MITAGTVLRSDVVSCALMSSGLPSPLQQCLILKLNSKVLLTILTPNLAWSFIHSLTPGQQGSLPAQWLHGMHHVSIREPVCVREPSCGSSRARGQWPPSWGRWANGSAR